jgi:hypothetical protein
MRYLMAVLCIAVAALAFGGELKITGDTKVKEHRLGKLTASGIAETAQVRWSVPAELDYRRVGQEILFTGPPGTYKVNVLAIDFDAKSFSESDVSITIEGIGKTIPPTPPITKPTPPTTPPTSPKPDAAEALCRLRVGRSGCTATIVGPRRPDGRWDVLTANHCWGSGTKGQITLKDGKTLSVTLTEKEKDSDIAWMVTDDVIETLPFAMLAKELPGKDVKVWHAGYGFDRPGNREDGHVLGASGGQLSFHLNVSSGDSGGGIFRADTNELLACVCCTRSIASKTTMWGGHCVRAAQLRPKAASAKLDRVDVCDRCKYHPIQILDDEDDERVSTGPLFRPVLIYDEEN